MKKGTIILSTVALFVTATSAFTTKVAHKFSGGNAWYWTGIGCDICTIDPTCKLTLIPGQNPCHHDPCDGHFYKSHRCEVPAVFVTHVE